jgi:hypothetical protein
MKTDNYKVCIITKDRTLGWLMGGCNDSSELKRMKRDGILVDFNIY